MIRHVTFELNSKTKTALFKPFCPSRISSPGTDSTPTERIPGARPRTRRLRLNDLASREIAGGASVDYVIMFVRWPW